MAQFPVLRLTRAGQDMVGASQGGGKLIFVRAELGDGQLGEGDPIETLSAIKHRVMQLPLQGCLNEGNGKARLRFVVDNGSLTTGFFNREIGIIAKMEGGDEQLYAYTNAGNYADYIPSKDTPIDSEIIDLHILIGNASQVVLQTANGAYATKIELEEHRTAAELDHPNKSVHKKHLADNVYTLPNPEAANNARFLRNDNTWQAVTPGNIGAYTKTETYSKSESYNKGEVDSRVNAKVSKSGDTMTGALNFANDTWNKIGDDVFVGDKGASGKLCLKSATGNSGTGFALVNPNDENDKLYLYYDHNRNALFSNKWIGVENNVGGIHGYVYNNVSYWRLWGSDNLRPSTAYDIFGKGTNAEKGAIFIRKYVNGTEVVSNKIIAEDNNAYFQNAVTAATFYTNDWYRAKGNSGFYFQDHGGGWFMEDDTWIKSWGSKSIYTAGKMKADGGFEGKASSAGWADSAGNSNTLAGQSLQWIIDRINEAKTGIVAGNLDENGWVKFANGLIVQWGAVKRPNKSVNFPISFPSKIFQLLYTTELHFNEVPDGTWFRLKNKTVSGAEWLTLTATDRFYIAIGR